LEWAEMLAPAIATDDNRSFGGVDESPTYELIEAAIATL
jgi:hypothetical protein